MNLVSKAVPARGRRDEELRWANTIDNVVKSPYTSSGPQSGAPNSPEVRLFPNYVPLYDE